MQYRPKTVSPSIETQFPGFYRDDAPEFIDFVKSYYDFLDGSNERNFAKLRDIDTTLEKFLIYYKEKYLKDLILPETADIPFIVKNIGDLYLSKGTPEALELLFKMFYKVEVEHYHPASSILTLSDSKWSFGTFLELIPVTDTSSYHLQKGDVIEGDTSKAKAFVDEIVFYNIDGLIVPVAFISNVYRQFTSDDGLKVARNGQVTFPGKLIYGSITSAQVTNDTSTPDNKVGDPVKFVSDLDGVEGEGIVTGIDAAPTGVVEWQLIDGGWGYDVPEGIVPDENNQYNIPVDFPTGNADNIIRKSTQVLVLDGPELFDADGVTPLIQPLDTLQTSGAGNNVVGKANNGSGNYDVDTTIQNIKFLGTGTVIAYEHPNIFVEAVAENDAALASSAFVCLDTNQTDGDGNTINTKTTIPTSLDLFESRDLDIRTITTSVTLSRSGTTFSGGNPVLNTVSTMTRFNDTADFSIGAYSEVEDVRIISTLISDYVNVSPDSTNVNSGLAWTATRIVDGLGITDQKFGSIKELLVRSAGADYKNNVRTIVKHPLMLKFKKGVLGLRFDKSNIRITAGDIITQTIRVKDLSNVSINNAGGLLDKIITVKGEFIDSVDNTFFFKPLSFNPFRVYNDSDPTYASTISFRGETLKIQAVTTSDNYLFMGENASVEGQARSVTGRIVSVDVSKSGFRYRTGETVNLVNNKEPTTLIPNPKYQQPVGRAKLDVGGIGRTEGSWKTTKSHLSDNGRYIRDNDYYQEYSYEISSILDPSVYEKTVKDTVHVAGTKMFGAPLISTIDDVQPQIDSSIVAVETSQALVITESGSGSAALLIEQGGGTEDENTPEPESYEGLTNTLIVPGGYVTGQLYYIVKFENDGAGWNDLAGTTAQSYQAGSLITAANNGSSLSSATRGISAQLVTLFESNEVTTVAFDDTGT